MATIKKDNDFLNKEKNIYNHFQNIKRIVAIVKSYAERKRKIVETLVALLQNVTSVIINRNLMDRLRGRPGIRPRLLEDIEKSRNLLGLQIRKQKELLIRDLRISDQNAQMARDLEEISLLSDLNGKEKEILDEAVRSESHRIRNLLASFGSFFQALEEQERFLGIIVFKGKKPEQIMKDAAHFIGSSRKYIDIDEQFSNFAIREVQFLEDIAKNVIRSIEEFESYFNEHDLKELQENLLAEEKIERKRMGEYKRFLAEQRRLRDPLNVRQLIAVHMTDFFPDRGIIRTTGQNLTDFFPHFKKPEIVKKIVFSRETIHFSLNGSVGSHMMGGWSDKKYAILIPLHLIIDRVIRIYPVDTFLFGQLVLPPGSEILLKHKDAYGKAGNSKIIVVPENMSVWDAANQRIAQRGYTPISVGANYWIGPLREEDERIFQSSASNWTPSFNEFALQLDKEFGYHKDSFWHVLENICAELYALNLKEGTVAAEVFRSWREEVLLALTELKKRASRFASQEEIEAYKRIQALFLKLLKDLERKTQEI